MRENINFLIKVQKLKETTRTGWIIWRVKNPETIAEHTFRVCFLAFLLGKKKGLNLKRLLQSSLSHDLCEVYAGDATPLFYYQNLDVRRKRDREILFKGIRLSEKEKKRRSKMKFERERKSLLKLISPLRDDLRNEILLRWLDYEKGFSPEGKFAKQIDWIENLIQSLEYLGPEESGSGWWEIAEEKVYDPLLLDFLTIVQKKFYKKRNKSQKRNKDLENILDFILLVGRLKRMPRLYWLLRGIKKGETVAGHIFTLTLMAWIFGKEKKSLNLEKLLKMALCHELSAVFVGDTTPYDRFLPKDKKERKKVLEKMIRLSKKQKELIFLTDFQKEKKAVEKLTKNIEQGREILNLWEDYRQRKSREAIFLSQLNTISVLFQGLIYEKRYKNFSTAPLWEWAFENCDDQICLSILDHLKKKFYGN